MHAEHAMIVHDDCSVRSLRSALAQLSPAATVVLVNPSGGPGRSHHVFDVATLIAMLTGLPDEDVTADALDLDLLPRNRVHRFDDDSSLRPGDVLLLGANSAAVVMASGPDRGGDQSEQPERPDPAGAATPTTARFRAFPALTGPAAVTAGQRFSVTVGFTTTDPGGADTMPVIVPGAPERLDFVIQVAGFGLAFPDGIRAPLTVQRDAPDRVTASFTVEAGPVVRQAIRTVEVSYEYGGEIVGKAWLEVQVTAVDVEVVAAEPAASGGTGVQLADDADPPDLTVEIRSDGGRELEWVFHTRHEVPRPSQRVGTALDAVSAEAFATQIMALLPVAKGSAELFGSVRGMGRAVNKAVPDEFWAILEAIWRAVGPGSSPSLLLTTSEPFVPWELAWVNADWIDPAVLPAGVAEAPLGSLWRIGRWVPPGHIRRGPDRPAAPPDCLIDVRTIAVVVGDYSDETKVKDLPFAQEECAELVTRAQQLALGTRSMKATDDEVAQLLNPAPDAVGPDACEAVHIAAHGQVSTQQQQYTGILLAKGRRLDLLAVQGSTLGRVSRPLVFLNACQVGTAGRTLSTYGGLAGAFLDTGCRGFVAPLWNVDDDLAKQIALAFYDETLNQGLVVGEAMRRLRERFGSGEGGSATPLAYAFYGHPNLRLRCGVGADNDAGHGADG